MVSKYTVFAALAVALLAASACGHPTAEAEDNNGGIGGGDEETTTGYGLRARLNIKKPLDSAKDCLKRGKEILKWMEKKFKLFESTTVAASPSPPPSLTQPPQTDANKPVEKSGYETPDLTIDGDAVPEPVNGNGETSGQVDESPETNGQVEPETGSQVEFEVGGQVEPETGGQVEPEAGDGDSVENPYPIAETLSEFADQPTNDVRSTF